MKRWTHSVTLLILPGFDNIQGDGEHDREGDERKKDVLEKHSATSEGEQRPALGGNMGIRPLHLYESSKAQSPSSEVLENQMHATGPETIRNINPTGRPCSRMRDTANDVQTARLWKKWRNETW